jgi:hypothetical protein
LKDKRRTKVAQAEENKPKKQKTKKMKEKEKVDMSKPMHNSYQAPKMMPMWKVKKWLKEDGIGWVIIVGMVGL